MVVRWTGTRCGSTRSGQFIPSTWARWKADGNSDGVADPQNIDAAALAAGRYLCAGGRNLATGTDWWTAILSYNNSTSYVQTVLTAPRNTPAPPSTESRYRDVQ